MRREEVQNTGNDVYLENFTTRTQMHYGMRNEVDPELGRQENYFVIKKTLYFKSIICQVHSLWLIQAHCPCANDTATSLPCTSLTFGTITAGLSHIRK